MEIRTKTARRDNYGAARETIAYLVIHYTGGDGDTAAGNAAYFARELTGVSAHYFVDDSEVWRSVPEDHIAWHCGTKGTYYHPFCRNRNSIGIELCSRRSPTTGDYFFTAQTIERAAALTRALMAKYKIPVENVLRHYDVTHKCCPAPFVQESYAWSRFRAALTEEVKEVLIYHTLAEVPAWGQETVRALLERGYLAGGANGDLDLEHYMLRTLVIGYRAGLYQ